MKVYISGPMTGLPELNYPAFHAAAALLRALGHQVINPAENPAPPCGTYEGYMAISLAQVEASECVVMLPGWNLSSGAKREHTRAMELGLVAYPIEVARMVSKHMRTES